MPTVSFESSVVPPSELHPYLEKIGLDCTLRHVTEPHRGAVEAILHFVTENKDTIQLLAGIFGAFKFWLEYQKLQLEKRKSELEAQKDAREAEKHEIETEMKRLELLEKQAALRLTLKNNDVLVLANGTKEEIARQVEREAPKLKPTQVKRVELK